MGRHVKINVWLLIGVLIVGGIAVDQLALHTGVTDFLFTGLDGKIQEGTGEFSRFTGVAVAEDAPTTKITQEVLCAWYDANQNQQFDFEEVEQIDTAATTGVFTSGREYPIGVNIYLMLDDVGEAYQTDIAVVMMEGSRNSDGSAKSLGNVEYRATDDAITFSGLIGIYGIDDGTDYNATTYGGSATLTINALLATSDAGFSSQTHSKFGSTSQYSWLNEREYAPTFLGMYMTNQDAIDFGFISSEFDYYHVGATNTFMAIYVNNIGDGTGAFYDSDALNAPIWSASVNVNIDTTDGDAAILYVGLFQDVLLTDFVKDSWGPTTDATILGTCGADWDNDGVGS